MLLLSHVLNGVARVIDMVAWIYMLILFGRAITSWVSADPRNPIVNFLYAVTEPPMRAIRRRLPMSLRYFPLDMAFLVLLALVLFVEYAVVPALTDYAVVLRRRQLVEPF